MHNCSHHIQPKYHGTPIKKTLYSCNSGFRRVLICVLVEVSTGDVLTTRLRLEQSTFCNRGAAAERPYSCRVLPLRENNTRIVDTCKLFLQKAIERFFVSIVGCRERDAPLGKRMCMDIDNGIDIVPVGQFN